MSKYVYKLNRICVNCKSDFLAKLAPDGRPTSQKYCSEKCHDERRKWRRSRAYGRTVVSRFKTEYGIILTVEQAERLQISPCEICGRLAGDGTQRSPRNHIDHDHKTNKVRGTLCYKCNHGVGLFEDDITRLRKAIDYLSKPDTSGFIHKF